MTETALAVQEEKALMARLAELGGTGVAGLDNLRPGDVGMPPRLRISQQNRPIELGGDAEAQPGTIVNSLTNEVHQSLEIVPLVFLPRTRVMWPDAFDTGNDPLCISDDGDHPLPADSPRVMTNRQPGPCAECVYSKFGENGEAPPCKLQRNFLVMTIGDKVEPAILTLQSTAIASAKQLTSLAMTQGIKNAVTFTTQKIKSDQGQWFVPAFAKGRALTPAELVDVAEQRNDLKNLVISADIESHATNGFSDAVDAPITEEEMDAIPF